MNGFNGDQQQIILHQDNSPVQRTLWPKLSERTERNETKQRKKHVG